MRPKLRKWLYAAGTIAIAGYLITIAILTRHAREERLCNGIYLQIIDSARQNFVTAAELRQELGNLPQIARRLPVAQINIDSLEKILRAIDKIESVRVQRYTDASIHITVEPMRPVARIFEPDRSYYINKDGKKISAEARYHVDVPVIYGNFPDSTFSPRHLLPMLDQIRNNERWNTLMSMVKVDSPHDVLIIPAIRGLVFNIGTPDNLPSKLMRLERMLNEVLPVKGWEYYDTISVKWNGQIVATRRIKERIDTAYTEVDVKEDDDLSTMSIADNVAAGQALPGKKANAVKPVPGTSPGVALKNDTNDRNTDSGNTNGTHQKESKNKTK